MTGNYTVRPKMKEQKKIIQGPFSIQPKICSKIQATLNKH